MATSASQLSVCMAQLECSIAWEKSLLKVVSPGEVPCVGPVVACAYHQTHVCSLCMHLRLLCVETLCGVVGSAGGVAPTPFLVTDIWLIH